MEKLDFWRNETSSPDYLMTCVLDDVVDGSPVEKLGAYVSGIEQILDPFQLDTPS